MSSTTTTERRPLRVRRIKKYGWRPDLPDKRDHYLQAPEMVEASWPPVVDLRPNCPPVYDQGDLGSCTGNAIAGAIEFDLMKQAAAGGTEKDFPPSRLFIYYNERVMEGDVSDDAGAEIRDGIKSVASQGDCPEPVWPYDVSQFAVQPTQAAYDAAVQHKALSYLRLFRSQSEEFNVKNLRYCVASLGVPVVFGFTVYESFESDAVATTGVLPMPGPQEAAIGGHAVMVVGYKHADKQFIIRNSWGTNWGDAGYFYMPYAYVADPDLCDDFWIIKTVA